MGGEENLSNNRCINPLKKNWLGQFSLTLGPGPVESKNSKSPFYTSAYKQKL
jgi:hypothetical protein